MKKLKKIVMKIPIFSKYYEYFNLFKKFEIIKIFRQDGDHFYITQKAEFKDSKMHPKMLEGEYYGIPYVEVIEENKMSGEYIFFSTNNIIKETKELSDNLECLIIDVPIILDQNHLLTSSIIDSRDVDKFINLVNLLFDEKVEILSITNLIPNYEDLFLKLTERQKEIIYYAVHRGYFEIPREIKAEKIANRFKITQSAFYDHLRKIDRIIYHSIFK